VAVNHPAVWLWPAFGLLSIGLVLGLFIVGFRYLTGEDSVERPAGRIAQFYGYSVCLIAVIVFVTSVQSLTENAISAAHPLEAASVYGAASLSSFEAYKATYRHPPGGFVSDGDVRRTAEPQLPDADLRAQYEALRSDRLQSARFQSQRDLAVSSLMAVIAIVLFWLHWRWLRTLASA